MEAAVELDDDVFFADLSKRISLLICDDEDEDSFPHYPSAFSRAIHPAAQASVQHPSRRESKGTGVFIPRSLNPRRKNARQGKSTGPPNKFQRPIDHYGNSISPSQDQHSFNLRRF